MSHVLVLLENQPYPYDPRVRAQTRALCDAGYEVTVLGPAGAGFELPEEDVGGVRVLRFQPAREGSGPLGYVREWGVAFVRLRRLVRRVARERAVDVVLVCNPPDFLVSLARPLVRRGAGLVLDDRELSPELYEAKYGRRGLVFRLLVALERHAMRRADAILITNPSYADNVISRAGVSSERVFVVGNGPDPDRVYLVEPRPELRLGRRHLVLWLGAMSAQEGLGQLVAAADELVRGRGRTDVTFALVGPGDGRADLIGEVRRRGLEDFVDMPGAVGDDLVRAYLSTADVCVNVDPPTRMNDRAAMRKVLEYMLAGRPVVQFPLAEMQRLCGDATEYARSGDAADLARRIEELLDDPERRLALGEAGSRRIRERGLAWPDQVPALLAAVRRATG